MMIEDIELSEVDVGAVQTAAEAHNIIASLDMAAMRIDGQIMRESAKGKDNIDWDWLRRAKFARKYAGMQRNQINLKLHDFKLSEKRENIKLANTRTDSGANKFVEQAKLMLDEEAYQDIWDVVNQRETCP